MSRDKSPQDRLVTAIAALRLLVLCRSAQELGLPAEPAGIREKLPKMSDREILTWLQSSAASPSRDSETRAPPRGFWRRLLLYWPFR